jgi:hypothetical protein
MPKIGGKKYAYTPAGVAAAKRESKKTGTPITRGAMRLKKAKEARKGA